MTPMQKLSPAIQRRSASHNEREPLVLCPLTLHPCEGALPIYAKTMVALVRAACRHSLRKTYEWVLGVPICDLVPKGAAPMSEGKGVSP